MRALVVIRTPVGAPKAKAHAERWVRSVGASASTGSSFSGADILSACSGSTSSTTTSIGRTARSRSVHRSPKLVRHRRTQGARCAPPRSARRAAPRVRACGVTNRGFRHLQAVLGTLASKWRGPGVARQGRRKPEYWTVFGRPRTPHSGDPAPPFQVERFGESH
jgi:hypothetical protein